MSKIINKAIKIQEKMKQVLNEELEWKYRRAKKVKEVLGEEWEQAKKELRKYWFSRCDDDVLIINLKILKNEMMVNILFDNLSLTMSGAVYRANRGIGWWWNEDD